jgi:hypothetical protein
VIVSNWKSIGKNTLVGAFDLELASGFLIHGVMYFEKSDSSWCAFPGIPFEKQDGTKSYKPILEIPDRARRDEFNAKVIAALKQGGHI